MCETARVQDVTGEEEVGIVLMARMGARNSVV